MYDGITSTIQLERKKPGRSVDPVKSRSVSLHHRYVYCWMSILHVTYITCMGVKVKAMTYKININTICKLLGLEVK